MFAPSLRETKVIRTFSARISHLLCSSWTPNVQNSARFSHPLCASTLRRALLILDAAIKALEGRGCRVEVRKGYSRTTRVWVGETTVFISLRERSARSERPVSKDRKLSSLSWQQWDFTPTGELSFVVDAIHTD